MVPFLDIHTHHTQIPHGAKTIQSLAVSERIFLAMPKTKDISIGIHPWYSKADDFETNLRYLKVLARQDNVLMIGECGLDKLRGEALNFQIEVLEAQLNFAVELNKPVILHCVKAFDELIAIKKRLSPTVPMIIHGFNKKYEIAEQLLRQGFYLSFGAAVLRSESIAQVVAQTNTPFFLETDDADVSIRDIYQKVAEIRKISIDELKDIIFANWKRFGLI